ncbi:MAG TPA: hypothetical protein H9887_09345 [Candidatus Dorea intestinavium]|nr:hypothetical protein [Candidatus Dorea intestinavium]
MAQRKMANNRQAYVYGSVVTQPAYKPDRKRSKEIEAPKKKPLSKEARRNRKREEQMNGAMVITLVIAAIATMIICMSCVKLTATVTKGTKEISTLQTQLSTLKEANNAKEGSVVDSVNMEDVRNKAINELGMTYANEGQIVEYGNPMENYVKQYKHIPEKGTLAKSDK